MSSLWPRVQSPNSRPSEYVGILVLSNALNCHPAPLEGALYSLSDNFLPICPAISSQQSWVDVGRGALGRDVTPFHMGVGDSERRSNSPKVPQQLRGRARTQTQMSFLSGGSFLVPSLPITQSKFPLPSYGNDGHGKEGGQTRLCPVFTAALSAAIAWLRAGHTGVTQ